MKRLIPLLALLLWPFAASAQIVSPGGGQMLSSATIVGGNCTNPQFVQGVSTNGTPTCATPTLGSGVPNGAPPQFVGYSATNVGESETLGGDATLSRTGANAYSLVVTKTNGTVFSAFATAASPLAITLGGTGSGTAPTAGQILVAQSATVFSPVAMSGDATITNGGAVTVTKSGGTALTSLFLPLTGGSLSGPGNLTVGGTFTASGAANFNSGATVSFGLTVPNYMNVSGAASFGGTVGLSANATTSLQAVPLQQLNSAIAPLAPKASPTFTGTVTLPDASTASSTGFSAIGVGVAAGAAGTLIVNNIGSLTTGTNMTGLNLTNVSGSEDITIGPIAAPVLSIRGYTPGSFGSQISLGSYTNGTNWYASNTNSAMLTLAQTAAGVPAAWISLDTGLTIGNTFSPTSAVFFLPNGVNIGNNSMFMWGNSAQPQGNLTSLGADTLYAAAGQHYNGSNWIADATTGQGFILHNPGFDFYAQSGATVGNTVSGTLLASVQLNANNAGVLLLPNTNTTSILIGSTASTAGSFLGWPPTSPTSLYMFGGSYFTNSGRTPTGTYAEELSLGQGVIAMGINTGLTPGTVYNTNARWSLDSVGMILNGQYKNNNVGVGYPTVSTGATLQSGSSDSVGEVISAAGSNTVTLTFSHCFTGANVACVLADDGQGYFWIPYSKGNCGVSFSCVVPTTGAGCPGSNYVNYFCFGYGG